MNLLKINLREIHEEGAYNTDWCRENLGGSEYVYVIATWECYGRVYEKTDIFHVKKWNEIKENGYYLG